MELSNFSDPLYLFRKFDVAAVERVLFEPGTLKIHLKQKLLRDITYKVFIDFQTSLKNDSNGPFYMRSFFDNDTHMERFDIF